MFNSKNDAQSKDLTVQDRAVAALGLADVKKKLVNLAKSSKSLVEITNQDSYQQVHAARIVLKNQRVDIAKTGKAARDDANAFSKALIAEENKLIDIISPEENRLQALQTEYDKHAEHERQAKIDAEVKRVEDIQAQIAGIREHAVAGNRFGITAKQVKQSITDIETIQTDDSFAEFIDLARDAKTSTLVMLNDIHTAIVLREEAEAKATAESAELEELRAANEKREAKEKAEREAAEAEVREKREVEEKKQREELEAQRKEQAEAQKKIDDESARLAKERADLEREQREEADRKAAEEKAEQDRRDVAQAAAKKAQYPGERAIVEALVEHFGVPSEVVMAWLTELRKAA